MAMFKDAKEWIADQVDNGMSIKELLSFVLCYTDNDDIERYFGVSMESSDDNPGAEICPICYRDSYDNEVCSRCVETCGCGLDLDTFEEIENFQIFDMCLKCWACVEFWSDFFETMNNYIEGF